MEPDDIHQALRGQLKQKLTPEQYKVTQQEGTEPPFRNEYWDNHEAGIYVDVVSGEPLFSSLDKYESGTGWPSFTRPLEPANVVDTRRTRSSDGAHRSALEARRLASGPRVRRRPKPTGQRYCMNSASLRFIPVDEAGGKGYGQYLPLFQQKSGSR